MSDCLWHQLQFLHNVCLLKYLCISYFSPFFDIQVCSVRIKPRKPLYVKNLAILLLLIDVDILCLSKINQVLKIFINKI